jgi:hypothetical protein
MPAALGRWHINYVPEVMDIKVNQANEDHCGCCHYEMVVALPEPYLEPFVLY